MAAKPTSAASVVRKILSANPKLSNDEVVKKAQASGLKKSAEAIRAAVYNARTDLNRGDIKPTPATNGSSTPAAKSGPIATNAAFAAKPSAAKPASDSPKAPPPPIRALIRSMLTTNLDRPTDDILRKAQALGVSDPLTKIRRQIVKLRSELKQAARKSTAVLVAKPVPVAAPKIVASPSPAPATAIAADLAAVLGNVELVNTVVGVAGGVENARKVADAVRACGGVDAFLHHVDLVAGIQAAR